ncbi:MAG: hypothetical protein RLY84_473 [Actinomycetota bacterium]|jgi:hypothetical protein
MIRLSRFSLALIAFAFGTYHGLLGIFSLSEYSNPELAITAIGTYFFTLFVVVFDKAGIRMSIVSTLIVLINTVVISQLIYAALPQVTEGSYATWHIGALSTLLGIVAIRQYPAIAWFGFAAMSAQVLAWGGLQVAFNSGLVGGLLLVAVGQAAFWAIVSSANSAVEFRMRAIEIDTSVTAASAARAEKMQRLQQTLSSAMPLLEKIQRQSGDLNPTDRAEAVLLEAQLRDQIRGRSLLNPEIIKATRDARIRGVEVQLLDDGGLDDLSDDEKEKYLSQITEHLRNVKAGKVVIRASIGEGWRVTMAAIQKDADRPDLFIRL